MADRGGGEGGRGGFGRGFGGRGGEGGRGDRGRGDRGRGDRGRGRRGGRDKDEEPWVPCTKLGRLVQQVRRRHMLTPAQLAAHSGAATA